MRFEGQSGVVNLRVHGKQNRRSSPEMFRRDLGVRDKGQGQAMGTLKEVFWFCSFFRKVKL